jgi:hypothetical protein
VNELTTEMCAFPGCERPVARAPEGAGRPSRYCETPGHNAQSAFRERRRRAAAGELDGGDGAEQGGGDRPVSLAGATLRAVAARLTADLERTRDALGVLTDTEQLEAELAAVRADTQPEVSHAAEQRDRARRASASSRPKGGVRDPGGGGSADARGGGRAETLRSARANARDRSTVVRELVLRPGFSSQARMPPTACPASRGGRRGLLVLTAGPVPCSYGRYPTSPVASSQSG